MGTDDPASSEFARDVRSGLGGDRQKQLPAKYLYDALGSALFDAITLVPEYGLARADERLLRRLSPELPPYFEGEVVVGELGSGSGTKTRHVLKALTPRGVRFYWPIDVSSEALNRCRRVLRSVAQVRGFHGGYVEGVRALAEERPSETPILLMFLGSSIGNFSREEARQFLCRVRALLRPGDYLLMGADLVKPDQILIDAYDDAAGVTAAFNLNVLGRMNRELGADFDLRSFKHEARYDAEHGRIEMHLRSTAEQTVKVPAAGIESRFVEGETIWTESSHKFTLEQLRSIAASTSFETAAEWVDEEWPFAELLWEAR